MLEEFKKFAMRGNVADMAVGIVIGAAFGKIVSSFPGRWRCRLSGSVPSWPRVSRVLCVNKRLPLPGTVSAGYGARINYLLNVREIFRLPKWTRSLMKWFYGDDQL